MEINVKNVPVRTGFPLADALKGDIVIIQPHTTGVPHKDGGKILLMTGNSKHPAVILSGNSGSSELGQLWGESVDGYFAVLLTDVVLNATDPT
jgi:hypothetical protein